MYQQSLYQVAANSAEVHANNDKAPTNNGDLSTGNSRSVKYKAALVGKIKNAANRNSFIKNAKIVVSSKYLSNFWRSLEMSLMNYKVHLKSNWIEDYILSSDGDPGKFKITDAKLHVPIVTLSTKDNVSL